MCEVKVRNISLVTIFRVDMELTPMMKIKVWVYKKTSEGTNHPFKKYASKAPPNDPYATREVKTNLEYKNREDRDKKILSEKREEVF
jgi:ATP-dependent DNA helicase 2 subunit 2